MKKNNANNKLAFNKAAVAELNNNLLQQVNGGNSTTITIGTTSLIFVTISKDIITKEN